LAPDAYVVRSDQFLLRFARVTLQFRNIEGNLRTVPRYRPRKCERGSGSSWLIIFKIPWAAQKFAFQLGELPVDFFVRKFGTVRCVIEP